VSEHFVVRHYTEGEGPVFKGNGFDGTRVGEDREEAEELAAWINQRLDEAQRYYQALQGAVADQAEDRKRIRELEAALRKIVSDGDYTAPEGMKRIAIEALNPLIAVPSTLETDCGHGKFFEVNCPTCDKKMGLPAKEPERKWENTTAATEDVLGKYFEKNRGVK
jgi:hypothetical protein